MYSYLHIWYQNYHYYVDSDLVRKFIAIASSFAFGGDKNGVRWIDGQGVLQGGLFWPTLPHT